MDFDIRKLVVAGLLTGALGFGVAAMAGAQEPTPEDPTTRIAPDDDTTSDDVPATSETKEDCDGDSSTPNDTPTSDSTAEVTAL